MSTKTYRSISTKVTPQSEPLKGQVKNSAGGYSFQVDDWKRLDRFLLLGSEKGTYYIGQHKLTKDNADAVQRCIESDGRRVVNRIVEISELGRAPKNDPALFALAMCASLGNPETRKFALESLPRVARIGTHLFHFAAYVEQFRGWGRGLRNAIATWYQSKNPKDLAYQAVKYQFRDGWGNRDLLRLSHPKPDSETRKIIYHWMVNGWESVGNEPHSDEALRVVWAFERAKTGVSSLSLADKRALIREYNLPREAVPTEWLNEAWVWEALLEKMPYEAMTRNLATMTRVGLIAPMSDAAKTIAERLGNQENIVKARLHPIKILAALKTYEQGHGERGQNTWTPLAKIVDALDGAFYLAFRNVTPTNKRMVLALDVSGSMGGSVIAGIPGLTARDGSAAMALVTARTEPNYEIIAFQDSITQLTISPQQRLDDVVRKISDLSFGATDCAQPMLWAIKNKVKADAFVVYTDSETWAGVTHPTQALIQYRQKFGIPAKLVVVGMCSNEFTIADPNDTGMLDVAGFDTATPEVLSQFVLE